MEVTGFSPASLAAQKAGDAAADDSGLYLLKHRAKLHNVRSYGYATCGRAVQVHTINTCA